MGSSARGVVRGLGWGTPAKGRRGEGRRARAKGRRPHILFLASLVVWLCHDFATARGALELGVLRGRDL